MAELDLLDLLSADHRNLLGTAKEALITAASQHLSVERDLLYPAIREYCAQGEAIVERLRRSERRLEERMADFELRPSKEHEARLDEALREHTAAQDKLFPDLRRQIPSARLTAVLSVVPLSIGGSPTHAHPHLADAGALGAVVEDVTSVANHVRDRARRPAGDRPDGTVP